MIDAFQLVSVRCRHVLGLHFYRPMFGIVVIGDQVRNHVNPLVGAAKTEFFPHFCLECSVEALTYRRFEVAEGGVESIVVFFHQILEGGVVARG